MYLAGTAYDFENRLHSLCLSKAELSLFIAEGQTYWSGYSDAKIRHINKECAHLRAELDADVSTDTPHFLCNPSGLLVTGTDRFEYTGIYRISPYLINGANSYSLDGEEETIISRQNGQWELAIAGGDPYYYSTVFAEFPWESPWKGILYPDAPDKLYVSGSNFQPDLNGVYSFAAISSGKNLYLSSNDSAAVVWTIADYRVSGVTGNAWLLVQAGAVIYFTRHDTTFPWLATGWAKNPYVVATLNIPAFLFSGVHQYNLNPPVFSFI